ncbi:DUF1684 domain-containing protein [Halanaeroarchaeum sp. HSR-CO]|uniref:DUF1684 domain-containing protein n=1 Tax=Halanaeroarchaeum sp. HSR-CO TaxID=2866382 RepID=UPI00217EE1C1|nr:DUF1684 domain-containing protein [Halanaeroarchaeum sp. HSR-CO]
MPSDYVARMREEREQKEQYFGNNPRSPIPPEEREDFEGLAYFPVDEDLRFELPLHEHDDKEELIVETTTGSQREYLRWGEFRFEIDGEAVTLQAYKADPHEEYLWVPFRDDTNSEETYGAGRYLDLHYGEDQVDDRWILDFNEAYNPTCAYNEAYECPLIPTENWLDVRIEAGEKAYPGETQGYEH